MLIADWINLSGPTAASLMVTYVLIKAFWPLTVLAVIATGSWLPRRKSTAARMVAGVAVAFWAISAVPYFYYVGGEAVFRAQLRSRQETLQDATAIAGIQLPAGTRVTYLSATARDEIESLDLQHEASVYGIPLTGQVTFDGGRPDGFVTLARDVEIGGVPCSAKADVQLKRGTLDTCTLSRPSRVRGIPCRGDVSLSNDGVQCTLASQYSRFGITWQPGTAANIGDSASFDVMARAPNLYLMGSPLPGRAVVEFENGRLYGINLTNTAWHYHGCSINYVAVQNGNLYAQPIGKCGVPKAPNGYVPLPTSALGTR